MRRILAVLLENEFGSLSRVIGLFSQRGYNIESLAVAPTEDPSLSSMTIQIISNNKILEQIKKQLYKLVDVLKVTELKQGTYIEREIMLLKIYKDNSKYMEIKNHINNFHANILKTTLYSYIIQIVGTSKELDIFLGIISNITKILEITRSGVLGISTITKD